jgi:uncharacterized protein
VPGERAVLDTSVLVAAVLRPEGPSGKVLEAARAGAFSLVTSAEILDELVDVLTREKIQRYAPLSEEQVATVRLGLQRLAERVPGEYRDLDLVERDSDDNIVAAAAFEMEAGYIVTLDIAHMLSQKAFRLSGHRVVQIVRPEDFLRVIRF